MYAVYDHIATSYPGWGLTEIRGMSARQREYWVAMIKWKIEKERNRV